jgi:hypothetical protein
MAGLSANYTIHGNYSNQFEEGGETMGFAVQNPSTRKDVVLIVPGESRLADIEESLETLGVSRLATRSLDDASRMVRNTGTTARLLCLSTDCMAEVLAHNADRLIEITEPLRRLLGNPPMLIIDACSEYRALRIGGVIRGVAQSHVDAPDVIVELLRELDHA